MLPDLRAIGTVLVVLGAGVYAAQPVAGAGVLAPGARSGNVHVEGDAYASGTPGHPFDLAQSVPATEPGNMSVSGLARTFGSSGNTVSVSSAVTLNSVVSDDYSLGASCSYSYTNYGYSGACYLTLSAFSFSQEIVVQTPASYQLTLAATRPVNDPTYYPLSAAPWISFTGPGIADIVQAPGYPWAGPTPVTNSETYSGVLQPGTYTFAGQWSGGSYAWQNYYSSTPLLTLGVSGELSVVAAPEPASLGVLALGAMALLRRRGKKVRDS